jgi:hypothetical protein
VTNAAAAAVVSTATLGYVEKYDLVEATDADRAYGYDTAFAFGKAGWDILVGVGTGGAAGALSKGGTVAKTAAVGLEVFDLTTNVVNLGRGIADVYNEGGLTWGNALQIGGSLLGMVGNRAALKQGMSGKAATAGADAPASRVPGMASGPYQSPNSVIDFTTRYYDDLNRVAGNRMRQLGVPDDMIGIRNYPGIDEGPFVRFPSTQVGGNVNPHVMPGRQAGIALDHGVLDAAHPRMGNVPSWGRATLRDRMDAAIVHEYIEATLRPSSNLRGHAAVDWLHNEAIRRAPDTTMPITPGARQILTEYRQAAGLAP